MSISRGDIFIDHLGVTLSLIINKTVGVRTTCERILKKASCVMVMGNNNQPRTQEAQDEG
jgi:hypothetical protein